MTRSVRSAKPTLMCGGWCDTAGKMLRGGPAWVKNALGNCVAACLVATRSGKRGCSHTVVRTPLSTYALYVVTHGVVGECCAVATQVCSSIVPSLYLLAGPLGH